MRAFADIEQEAARRKGGAGALAHLLSAPAAATDLRRISDDRWLSEMTKCVFQAGFSWQVIENKWDAFEKAFDRFDIHRWMLMSDDDVDRLLAMPGIVANGPKIRSVGLNAAYLTALASAHGGVGAYFASWRPEDYGRNILALQAGGARLGGRTGQVFLRRMGVDTLVFSPDVVRALQREGVIDGMPKSARAFDALQSAIDAWRRESGRPLTQISQILAFSVDGS